MPREEQEEMKRKRGQEKDKTMMDRTKKIATRGEQEDIWTGLASAA